MDYLLEEYPKAETFRERAIRLLQEKAVRDKTRKLSARSIRCDPLCPRIHLLEACFGSVDNAIRAAGLYPTRANKDDALRSLREFYQTYHRSPRTSEASSEALVYSRDVYKRLFGSWNAALEAAGLAVIEAIGGRKSIVTDDAAIVEAILKIRDFYGDSGILPTTDEHDRRHPECKAHYFIRRVGKWSYLAELSNLQLQSERTSSSYESIHDQQTRAAS